MKIMAKIISSASTTVHADDDFDIDFWDDDQPDSGWEWVIPVTESVDPTKVIASDKLCEESLTATRSFDFSRFWLSSIVDLLQVIPTPALLVDRFCSVVFANESCAKPGADLGPIEGWSLPGLLINESDCLKVYEAVSDVFDSGKSQVIEAVLRATGEIISCRMRFGLVGLNEEKLALVLIEEVRAERELEVFSSGQEDRLRKARDTLHKVRGLLNRRVSSNHGDISNSSEASVNLC
jgi:hypothetical protein